MSIDDFIISSNTCACGCVLLEHPTSGVTICAGHCDEPHSVVSAHPSLPSCQACVVLGVVGTPERLA